MEFVKSLFSVFIVVLLVAVLGIALRGTIVSKMCALSSGYSVTLDNGTTETFTGSGVDCATNGLLYTWGLIVVALAAVIGLIFTGVRMISHKQ